MTDTAHITSSDSNDRCPECNLNTFIKHLPRTHKVRLEVTDLRMQIVELKNDLEEAEAAVDKLMTETNKGGFPVKNAAYWRKEYVKLEAILADTKEELDDMKEYYESAMREPCTNEIHCSCVPALRKRAEVAEAEVKRLHIAAIDKTPINGDNSNYENKVSSTERREE